MTRRSPTSLEGHDETDTMDDNTPSRPVTAEMAMSVEGTGERSRHSGRKRSSESVVGLSAGRSRDTKRARHSKSYRVPEAQIGRQAARDSVYGLDVVFREVKSAGDRIVKAHGAVTDEGKDRHKDVDSGGPGGCPWEDGEWLRAIGHGISLFKALCDW